MNAKIIKFKDTNLSFDLRSLNISALVIIDAQLLTCSSINYEGISFFDSHDLEQWTRIGRVPNTRHLYHDATADSLHQATPVLP